jgi:hypothetical protein
MHAARSDRKAQSTHQTIGRQVIPSVDRQIRHGARDHPGSPSPPVRASAHDSLRDVARHDSRICTPDPNWPGHVAVARKARRSQQRQNQKPSGAARYASGKVRSLFLLRDTPNCDIITVNGAYPPHVPHTDCELRYRIAASWLEVEGTPQMPSAADEAKATYRGRWWFRVLRLCLFLLMAVFLLAAALGFHVHFASSARYWALRSLSAVLALAAAYLYMRTSNPIASLDGLPAPNEKFRLIPLEDAQLLKLKLRAGSTEVMDLAEAQVFALATIYPSMIRQRISERQEPERRTIHQSVILDIKIPNRELGLLNHSAVHGAESASSRRSSSIPIPVLILPKGELNDDLRIYSEGDEPVPAYSYSEYLQLAARALHALLVNACTDYSGEVPDAAGSQAPDTENIRAAENYVQEAEDKALGCIMRRGPFDPDEKQNAIAAIRDLNPPHGLSPERSAEARTLLYLAMRLVDKFTTQYAIVVPVSCGDDGHISLRYERNFIPSLELSTRPAGLKRFSLAWMTRWSKDRLRFLLGARPVRLNVSLENACTCQSYHMVVACPEGLYLRTQRVPGINDYFKENARPTNVPPYCRLRRRLGQPYAHFYSRYFPEPKEPRDAAGNSVDPPMGSLKPPSLQLIFHEVPPASIFRAALVAVSTTLLIWLIGIVISHAKDGDPGTDAPAFLLAFPAIIATWLGFDAPSRRLLEGTLGARLSLIFSAVTAIAGSGLFMIYKAQLGFLHGGLPTSFSVLGISQVSWAALVVLSTANSLYACYFAIVRSWEFTHLSSRPISLEGTTQGG